MGDFDPDDLYRVLPFIAGAEVLQKGENTLTCLVVREDEVQVLFFGVPELGRVRAPLVALGNGLQVAALVDLAGTKAAVVQKRAEAKDYIDLDAILAAGTLSLEDALSAGRQIYGTTFSPLVTLKAVSYFMDGNLPSLAPDVRKRLAAAARGVRP